MNQNNWKLAISGSLEGWDVGSGGDDSFMTKEMMPAPISSMTLAAESSHEICGSLGFQ